MSEWSDGRIKGFITSVLRSGARRWPPKYETLNDACTGQKINEKTGRLAKHYEYNICKQEFTSKDIEIDHISPVVDPLLGFLSWDIFIKNLYCSKDNLQAICKVCHRQKTKKERYNK